MKMRTPESKSARARPRSVSDLSTTFYCDQCAWHDRSVRAAALLLLVASACGQTAKTPAPYPPPGRMVDLGGYRVHLYCAGAGSPTVMIVGGGFSFDWSVVQGEVARFTRVCSYYASGTAWSDPGPGRGCPAWVDEVEAVLRRGDVPGPYVLVGLS